MNTKKRGIERGLQTYSCNDCTRRFRNEHRGVSPEDLWFAYVFHKQTIRELAESTGHDKKTLVTVIDAIVVPKKTHHPRPIHLVVDATYFGKRTDDTAWGVVLFRDADQKENLWWKYVDEERSLHYREGKEFLEGLGYVILSVTCDGFSRNIPVFMGIPLQMCHFHMKCIVIRGTTLKPQTEAGKVLLALIRTLTYTTKEEFTLRLRQFHVRYAVFLNEKTWHPEGGWSYTHDGVRRAYLSVVHWYDYLFTCHTDRRIPNTTNTCDGHFSHVKDIVRIHRGLHKELKQKVIDAIFLESTIAPKRKKK